MRRCDEVASFQLRRAVVGFDRRADLGFGRSLAGVLSLSLMAFACMATVAHAETLRSALTAAYENNPELDAERARLRATDEDVQRARAGWGPSINANARIGVTSRADRQSGGDVGRNSELGVQLTQPIFTGFRTYNAVSEAEAEVRAGRALLRDIEGKVLVGVAQSYVDVVRDRELVALSQKIVDIFTKELSATRVRLGVGEVTRTDLAQAKSRRAEAIVALEEAKGELRRSEARYRQTVGLPVERLSVRGLLLGKLPATLSAATAQARAENPLVERALYREQAARFAVSKEIGELMPRLDFEAGYRRNFDTLSAGSPTDTGEFMGRLLVPLYQGGAVRARVRQSKHLHVSRLQEVEQFRREAASDLRVAWASLQAAKRKLASDRERIVHVKSALKGVRQEERVGQRTLLDVLNAEEEVFQAETSLVRDRRDRVLAHYQVLRAIGRLDAQFLTLAAEQYDPELHYLDAKAKRLSISITRRQSGDPVRHKVETAKLGAVSSWPVASVRVNRGARPVEPLRAGIWHTRTTAPLGADGWSHRGAHHN